MAPYTYLFIFICLSQNSVESIQHLQLFPFSWWKKWGSGSWSHSNKVIELLSDLSRTRIFIDGSVGFYFNPSAHSPIQEDCGKVVNFLEKESLTVRWCFPGWYKDLACRPFGGYFSGHLRCKSRPQWLCQLSLGILLSIQDPNPKTPAPSLPHPLLSNLGYLDVLLPCEMPRGLWSRSSIPYRERETKKRDQVHLEGPVQTETKMTTPLAAGGSSSHLWQVAQAYSE